MPKFKIDHKNMTPEEINLRQKQWSDYVRKRLHPTKECAKCHQTFDNDRENFQVNSNGRVLGVCRSCPPVKTKPSNSPAKEICPCCEKHMVLVDDRHAPAPVRLCRSCLNLINSIAASDQQTLDRMYNYVAWRLRGNAARFTVAPQENGAPPT